MRIVCVGGGPAGLYFSILTKLRDNSCEVAVYDRNAPGRTHGWGVVYWDDLVEELQASDPVSASAITESSVRWTEQSLYRKGRLTVHRGRGGYSIGRSQLLQVLASRAVELGVDVHHEAEVRDADEFPDADLIVASDGSGSGLRKHLAARFGTKVVAGRNKYIWLGTKKVLPAFTFALAETAAGWIWFHGYAHDNSTSTCVVECPPETWCGLALDHPDVAQSVDRLETIFADALDGHPLLAGESSWLSFRTVTNERWHDGKVVLMGDAAHTTHFTIGSGTRLALQDAIALSTCLGQHAHVEEAVAIYEQQRREALRQPQSEARFSAAWFESIERYMRLPDSQFFLLLRERRSPLLAAMPPALYYRSHTFVEAVPALRTLRRWIGPPARAVYSRWKS
jgi:2-polyprenyl-6-methoxyphenol hydroxylase-like FAD-dependent oxidoreductase